MCSNLHRAFDAGLLSLNDNYEILIKGKRTFEENNSPFNLRQFEGKKILLPLNEKFYPDLENLNWHRKEFGFS